jgi:hypothetical protein
MSFNVTSIAVAAPTAFTVSAGVQQASMNWTQPTDYGDNSIIEIWSSVVNLFVSATKLGETRDNKYIDNSIQANFFTYYYWVVHKKTFVGGTTKSSSAVAGSAIPFAAFIQTNAVSTAKIAANAVTNRTTYEETGNEYVRYGTDSLGGATNPGDETWTLPDINFTGDGNTQVITCICRQSETPVYFRVGNSTVWAKVEASIVNKTSSTVIDAEELTVAGIRVEQQGMAGSPWLTFPHHRDFFHNFVVPTVSGNSYCVRFKLTCGADDSSNYILWASTLRQVFWQIYKR